MKRTAIVAALVLSVVFAARVGFVGAATPTPNAGATISALETRVASLEERVSALETAVSGGPASSPASSIAKSGTHTITGTLTVNGDVDTITVYGQFCSGVGGYSDLDIGTPVVVKNGTGAVIATGSVGGGDVLLNGATKIICVFPFEVKDVPDSDFYVIEVSHRGGLTFSKSDLEASGWKADFSIGG